MAETPRVIEVKDVYGACVYIDLDTFTEQLRKREITLYGLDFDTITKIIRNYKGIRPITPEEVFMEPGSAKGMAPGRFDTKMLGANVITNPPDSRSQVEVQLGQSNHLIQRAQDLVTALRKQLYYVLRPEESKCAVDKDVPVPELAPLANELRNNNDALEMLCIQLEDLINRTELNSN